MKTFLAALITGAVAISGGSAFAQEKKSGPTKEELKQAPAKKADKDQAEAKKEETKKKVKKGGC